MDNIVETQAKFKILEAFIQTLISTFNSGRVSTGNPQESHFDNSYVLYLYHKNLFLNIQGNYKKTINYKR